MTESPKGDSAAPSPDEVQVPPLIQELLDDVATFSAEADRQFQQIANAGAEAEVDGVRVRILPTGAIGEIAIDDRAAAGSPVRLREAVLAAVRDASRNTSQSLVDSTAGSPVADQIASLARPAADGDADLVAGPAEPVKRIRGSLDDIAPTPELDRLFDFLDDDDPIGGIQRMLDSTEYRQFHDTSDPNRWQQDLTNQLSALVSRKDDLSARLQSIEATAEGNLCTVTVNAAGGLVDARFRPQTRGTPGAEVTTDLKETLAKAVADAAEQLRTALDASGFDAADHEEFGLFAGAEASQEWLPDDPRAR